MKKIKGLFAVCIFLFLASSIFAQSDNSVAETKSTVEKAACSTSSAACDSKAKEAKMSGVSTISNDVQVKVVNTMDNKSSVKSEAGCCGSDSKVEGAKMSDSKKGSCNSSVTKTASVENQKSHNADCKCEGCVKS
ncbi:MAG: hypothetical protein IPM32_06665 [Ignavibacteriae bacterium]|nr:hypothetical protein [Ignavibacteriota bacterium]